MSLVNSSPNIPEFPMKGILWLLATVLLSPVVDFQSVEARPNIIVIFTDDQTYLGIGYQNPEVKTPHLDALAASGIAFSIAT